jgi:hypothetical protein
MSVPALFEGLAARPSIGDLYAKLGIAAFVFFVTMEIGYFLISPAPRWSLPSVDVMGFAFGHDFVNLWMGATTVSTGGPATHGWFDNAIYNPMLQTILGTNGVDYYWSYPPHILLLLWPFGLMPYLAAYLAWCAAGFAAYYAVCCTKLERDELLFVAAAPAVAMAILNGQTGLFTSALLVLGLTNLDRRPVLAGIAFGCLTVKPQLGLLLPLMLLLTGRWRTILAACGTTIALAAATALWFGFDTWIQFFTKIMPQQRGLLDTGDGLLLASSVAPLLSMRFLRVPLEVAWAIQFAVSAVAAGAVIWTYWKRRDPLLSTALLVTATFLFAPYTLGYDMPIVAWLAVLLARRSDNTRFDHYLAVAAWALPIAMPVIGGFSGVPVGFFVMLAFGARLLWRLARAPERAEVTRNVAVAC